MFYRLDDGASLGLLVFFAGIGDFSSSLVFVLSGNSI